MKEGSSPSPAFPLSDPPTPACLPSPCTGAPRSYRRSENRGPARRSPANKRRGMAGGPRCLRSVLGATTGSPYRGGVGLLNLRAALAGSAAPCPVRLCGSATVLRVTYGSLSRREGEREGVWWRRQTVIVPGPKNANSAVPSGGTMGRVCEERIVIPRFSSPPWHRCYSSPLGIFGDRGPLRKRSERFGRGHKITSRLGV